MFPPISGLLFLACCVEGHILVIGDSFFFPTYESQLLVASVDFCNKEETCAPDDGL